MPDVGDSSLHNSPIVSVVDDDEAVRLALGSLVRSMGMQVRLYESATAFLDSGQAIETACLISDVCMSEISGIEMRTRLVEQHIDLPTIFVSAHATPALQAEAARSGALVLIEKPWLATTLVYWIMIALGRK
jgi:FixJ family two-component response regulator